MQTITLRQLLDAVHGTQLDHACPLDTTIVQVNTDSRKIREGDLFIPLVGDRFDGHAYVTQALNAGAVGCLTAHVPDNFVEGKFYVKVEDTELALGQLASWYRTQFPIPVIAVTGSVGKTTAKDMIAAVLSTKFNVLKTEGNFNNNIGLPLTVLRLDSSVQACVLEMGMDRFGEIDYLAGLVKPDIGVITNIGDAHIERLGSRENIFKAKCELLPHVRKDGLLVLNGDDALLSTLRGKTETAAVFYGADAQAQLEYRGTITGGDGVSHVTCRMETPSAAMEVEIPALGAHMVYPTLIAAAVGDRLGLTADQIEEGIRRFVPTRMRMNLLKRADEITILDDTYNANPQSMRAAIQVLSDSRTTRKVAILGDMLELGPFAPALHTGVGECMGKAGIDCLLAVGEMAEYLAQGARDSGVPQVLHVSNKAEAKTYLGELAAPDTTILVKASRGMKLEELTAALLELTREA